MTARPGGTYGPPVINLEHYGASTASPDNAPVIQKAIDENPGATLVLPGAGDAYLCSTLHVRSQTTIEGVNPAGMWVGPTVASMLKLRDGVNGPLIQSADAQFVTIRDVQLRGNKTNQTQAHPLISLPARATSTEAHWVIDNCVLWESKGDGLFIGDKNRGVQVTRTYSMRHDRHGIKVDGSDSQITHCFLGDNGVDGVHIAASGWTTMVKDCNIWGNRTGITALFARFAWLTGNFIDSNLQHGIYAQEMTGLLVSGNIFTGNSKSQDGGYPHLQIAPTMGSEPCVTANCFLPNKDGATAPLPSYDILVGADVTFLDGGNTRGSSSKQGYCNTPTAPSGTVRGALRHTGSTAGFYGATPVAKQTAVPVTADGVHAALVNLGLISA